MELPAPLTARPLVNTLLLLFCYLPLGGTTVMVFSVFDVFAELESWGRVTVGRFNATSGNGAGGWPVPDVTSHNSQTMEVTEVRLLDDKGEWVKSHHFDSSSRNFAVSSWETDTYNYTDKALRAHARRIETIRLGELSGQMNMVVYVATESGTVHDVNVTRGDVVMVLEMVNVTTGCGDCHSLEVVLSCWGHSQGPAVQRPGGTELFMMPRGTEIWLPNTVLLDGNLTELESGSPSFDQWDSALMATLRMPMFRSSAVYSAILRLGGESMAHLVEERPVHQVYGEWVTTDSPTTGPTSKEGGAKGDKEGRDKSPNGIANPEYRHVKDSSDTGSDKAHSTSLRNCPNYLATILLMIVVMFAL